MLEKGSAAAKLRQTEPVAINKSNSQYPEIAVLGRSNAGKSSLVNLLTWRSNLAPVSNTPGKTQQPNRFAMHPVKGSTWLLVDLPGYGFAKVPSGVSNKWMTETMEYLRTSEDLVRSCVLVDASIPPQQSDIECVNWHGAHGVPVTVVFTKWDKRKKIKQGKRSNPIEHAAMFSDALSESWDEPPPMVPTSASTNMGRDELLLHFGYVLSISEKKRSRKKSIGNKGSKASADATSER